MKKEIHRDQQTERVCALQLILRLYRMISTAAVFMGSPTLANEDSKGLAYISKEFEMKTKQRLC